MRLLTPGQFNFQKPDQWENEKLKHDKSRGIKKEDHFADVGVCYLCSLGVWSQFILQLWLIWRRQFRQL